MRLSTRPENFIGDVELWNAAKDQLRNALDAFGREYDINYGDGAFYGPKIDIEVFDALKRKHQCATIQLDFQLPRRFNLKFRGEDGQAHMPILIHRYIGISRRQLIFLALSWALWNA